MAAYERAVAAYDPGDSSDSPGEEVCEEDVEACERAFSSYNPGDSSDAHSETWTKYGLSSTETDPEARARGLELTESEAEWEREQARFANLSCDEEPGDDSCEDDPSLPADKEAAPDDGTLTEGERSEGRSDLGLTRPADSACLQPAQWTKGLPPPPQTDLDEQTSDESESDWENVPLVPTCAEEISSK